LTPGCTLAVYRDANGDAGQYCRMTHKLWGEKGCISCRRADKFGRSDYCRACETNGQPSLVPVPEDNETYRSVADQFRVTWRHPRSCPTIRGIYAIVCTQRTTNRYNAYRDAVEARNKFAAKGFTPGNQRRRWHGTDRNCTIGDYGRTSFCNSSDCSLCRIIGGSFDIAHSKKKHTWGRFGNGIYTSSTSSKSDDYSKNLAVSPWKAIILAHVVVGKPKKFKKDRSTLERPPAGFDSVVGEPSRTGSLNYDEFVVYTNDAVRPGYLVMYE